MRVLMVFGTRPEAIKMAPLVKALKDEPSVDLKVCVSAQHRQMLDQVLEIFDIKPDYDLDIMKQGQDLYDITSQILIKLRDVLDEFKPNLLLVHGDTTTASASALAAFYKMIKVAHVEAGLRSKNIYSPFPEEINRQLIGVIANYHFAPTEASKQNLLDENKDEKSIIVTGNSGIDALFLLLDRIDKDKNFKDSIVSSILKKYDISRDKKIVLVTGHRRENFGDGFINICEALKDIAIKNPDIDLIYPVHLNPNVLNPVNKILSGIKNIYLIEPMRYDEFVYLMHRAYFIITDSGGIQEEAPSLGKPVLVTRNNTERVEALSAGTIKLVGTDKNNIIRQAQKLIDDKKFYDEMSRAHNPYGDGDACKKIVEFIRNLKEV